MRQHTRQLNRLLPRSELRLLAGSCDPAFAAFSKMKSVYTVLWAIFVVAQGIAAQDTSVPTSFAAYWGKYCSCAAPNALPLTDSSAAQLPAATSNHTASTCSSLPLAGQGAECGASLGICKTGLCCGQNGFCSSNDDACDGTCQCKYSGINSKCRGAFPLPEPLSLPTTSRGGPCGKYVANCPDTQCCTQFGVCADNGNVFCSKASCRAACSPKSKICAAVSYQSAGYKQTIVRQDWIFTWRNLTLDGYTRPVIVANGQTFPTLTASVGNRIIVRVVNRLQEPLSVHWHGITQQQTNSMDGAIGVTQRPVMPGDSFIYNFVADTAGTFWWHSHFHTQYIDGLRGQLIIKDPTDVSYPVDTALVVNDWYHQLSSVLTKDYMSPSSGGNEPTPYTALLNGQGQGHCKVTGATGCTYSFIRGIASYCNSPKTKLRIINAGGFAVFNVSIGNHRMIVVAQDAVPVAPQEVGSIQINNGQRYDVLVCQANTTALSTAPVWIRAVMIDDYFPTPSAWNTSLGVLYYGALGKLPSTQFKYDLEVPILTPSRRPEPGEVVNPYSMKPVGGVAPPDATRNISFVIEFYNEPKGSDGTTQYAHLNDIALVMDSESPSLLERLSNNPNDIKAPQPPVNGGMGWNIINVDRGEVIDIYFTNLDGGEHPLHLHGHWFWVMAYGEPDDGAYNSSIPLKPHAVRDTITIEANSYLVMRFVANNPGAWMMHCHIDWHMAAGLGMIFKEGLA